MTTLSLSFNDIQLFPVQHNNQTWLSSVELAKALGYADEKSVSRIYTRNKEEFTAGMTAIFTGGQIDHPARQIDGLGGNQGLQTGSRIFSLRGCHLIAMFSKTAIAKQFRVWVLDILDKEVTKAQPLLESPTITKAQTGELFTRVKLIAGESGKIRSAIWSRFQNHYHLSSYKDLPADKYEDALVYLDRLKEEYNHGSEMLYISSSELQARIEEAAKSMQGELLPKQADIEYKLTLSGLTELFAKKNLAIIDNNEFVAIPKQDFEGIKAAFSVGSSIAQKLNLI